MAAPSLEMIHYNYVRPGSGTVFNRGSLEELTQVSDVQDLFVPGRTQGTENNNALMCESIVLLMEIYTVVFRLYLQKRQNYMQYM